MTPEEERLEDAWVAEQIQHMPIPSRDVAERLADLLDIPGLLAVEERPVVPMPPLKSAVAS